MSDSGLSKPFFINQGRKAQLHARFWIYGDVIIIFPGCNISVWAFYERQESGGLTELSKIYQHDMQVCRLKATVTV